MAIRRRSRIRELLLEFERALDPQDPGAGLFDPRIIGYGEMSTVFTFGHRELAGRAYKRMALFQDDREASDYASEYFDYHELLQARGIKTPGHDCETIVATPNNAPVLYLSQSLLDSHGMCNRLIHQVPADDALRLFGAILEKMESLFQANVESSVTLGLDAQLSNWCVYGLRAPVQKLPRRLRLMYIDTSTPLIRRDGKLGLDPELFLRICPTSLAWIVRRFFLDGVVDRYFSVRDTLIDLIANLYKEKCERLIPIFIERANRFLRENWPELDAIDGDQVRDYYREDARIWSLFLTLRRAECWWRTKILRGSYDLILPGAVER